MILGLLACTDPAAGRGSATILSGFDFSWEHFNHRLSHLGITVGDDGAQVGVVGGTSTTGVEPTYAEGCDASTCAEFPFTDTANVSVLATRFSAGMTATVGTVLLDVEQPASVAVLDLPWDAVPGAFEPVLAGFTLDSSGNAGACYDPGFGWLPRDIGVSLAGGAEGEVEVTVTFEAGLSLEEERACLDAAAAEAGLRVTVAVVGIAGLEPTNVAVDQSESWELGSSGTPDAQGPLPDPVSVGEGALGWQSLRWRFHQQDPAGRGAYLRSLGAWAQSGEASGEATNYSPGTQLSGFDVEFTGSSVSFPAEELTPLSATAAYSPALDAEGDVIPAKLDWSE